MHNDYMARGCIIIALRRQEGTGVPLKEWYAVAIPDRVQAVESLRSRKTLLDATLTVDSEASAEYLDQRREGRPNAQRSAALMTGRTTWDPLEKLLRSLAHALAPLPASLDDQIYFKLISQAQQSPHQEERRKPPQ